jgi:hypothetical protein
VHRRFRGAGFVVRVYEAQAFPDGHGISAPIDREAQGTEIVRPGRHCLRSGPLIN